MAILLVGVLVFVMYNKSAVGQAVAVNTVNINTVHAGDVGLSGPVVEGSESASVEVGQEYFLRLFANPSADLHSYVFTLRFPGQFAFSDTPYSFSTLNPDFSIHQSVVSGADYTELIVMVNSNTGGVIDGGQALSLGRIFMRAVSEGSTNPTFSFSALDESGAIILGEDDHVFVTPIRAVLPAAPPGSEVDPIIVDTCDDNGVAVPVITQRCGAQGVVEYCAQNLGESAQWSVDPDMQCGAGTHCAGAGMCTADVAASPAVAVVGGVCVVGDSASGLVCENSVWKIASGWDCGLHRSDCVSGTACSADGICRVPVVAVDMCTVGDTRCAGLSAQEECVRGADGILAWGNMQGCTTLISGQLGRSVSHAFCPYGVPGASQHCIADENRNGIEDGPNDPVEVEAAAPPAPEVPAVEEVPAVVCVLGDYNSDGRVSIQDFRGFRSHVLSWNDLSSNLDCGSAGQQSCSVRGQFQCDSGLGFGAAVSACNPGCVVGDFDSNGRVSIQDFRGFRNAVLRR